MKKLLSFALLLSMSSLSSLFAFGECQVDRNCPSGQICWKDYKEAPEIGEDVLIEEHYCKVKCEGNKECQKGEQCIRSSDSEEHRSACWRVEAEPKPF